MKQLNLYESIEILSSCMQWFIVRDMRHQQMVVN